MAEDTSEKLSSLETRETQKEWHVFYPGIEHNMIFVHGTPTTQKRNSILESGLRPPSKAVSSDTLARSVQFSTFDRYSGLDGYIFVFRLDEDDVRGGTKYLNRARTFSIGASGLIDPNKTVVIISKEQSQIFDDLQRDYRQAIEESEFSDTDKALDKIGEISKDYVEKVSNRLAESGDFVKGKLTGEEVNRLSQELVWNQLADSAQCMARDLNFYSTELLKCGREDFASFDEMMSASIVGIEDWESVRRGIEIIKALENQGGSGLDKISLTEGINFGIVEDFINWKAEKEKIRIEKDLKAEKLASMSTLQRLLYRLKTANH